MSEFTRVIDALPKIPPGHFSKLLLVCAGEFGQDPVYCLARAWQSSLPNQPVQWVIDQESYHLDAPYMIAERVLGWMYVPEPIETLPLFMELATAK